MVPVDAEGQEGRVGRVFVERGEIISSFSENTVAIQCCLGWCVLF